MVISNSRVGHKLKLIKAEFLNGDDFVVDAELKKVDVLRKKLVCFKGDSFFF